MIRVLHVISGLGHGGAEHMLLRVVAGRRNPDLRHEVVSLTTGGALAGDLRERDVPVRELGLRRPPSPLRLARFVGHVRRRRPDVCQGWLYDGNLVAALARAAGRSAPPVAWNVRHSLHDLGRERLATRITVRLGALLSSLPAAIVYNARSSAVQHEALGFRPDRRVILPNGFDTDRFRPREGARARLLEELGLGDGAGPASGPLLVGTVGRDHPMKDHAGLLEAVARLPAHRRSGTGSGDAGRAGHEPRPVHLVLAGPGLEPGHEGLARATRRLDLEGRVHLLGARDDVPRLLAGLDVFALPSAYGESFPNALGEAMACGTPCVATDVGDAARILDGHGEVVPPEDPDALARALARLLTLAPEERRRIAEGARRRIRERYGLEEVVRRYEELWSRLAGGGGPGRPGGDASHEDGGEVHIAP